jgi:RNA polymerase sigma-70 factor (ECF subfamily)
MMRAAAEGHAMGPQHPDPRLSRVSTHWTLVAQAHATGADEPGSARRELMHRYCGAAHRYLLGAVRDEDVAMELFQEFALRFVRGDFRGATAERGRFRDYVKAALRHLVTDYHRQRQARPGPLPADVPDPGPADQGADEFVAPWREALLRCTWEALAAERPAYHVVLLAQAERPGAPAAEVAADLTTRLGKPMTAGNVRVQLHRARVRFAELLVAEVTRSLGGPVAEAELHQELRDLGLLGLCRPSQESRNPPPDGA